MQGKVHVLLHFRAWIMEKDRPKRDEWSEGAVSSLLDAYEAKWIKRNRAKLKGEDWVDVARKVSARANSTKPPKTLTQCKNKIESMKKRYRYECNNNSVSWPLFDRLDSLLRCRSLARPPLPSMLMLLEAGPSTDRNALEGGSNEAGKKRLTGKRRNGWQLARSIRRLADAMVRTEKAKMEAMKEVKRARAEIEARNRELELRRIEIITKTQMKIARLLSCRKHKGKKGLDHGAAAAISVAGAAVHYLLQQ